MKHILYIASLFVLLTSCGGGDDSAPSGGGGSNEYLNVNDIDMKGDETTAKLSVKASPNCEWAITCADSWVTSIVPSKGRGESDVIITVPTNPSSTDARKATITVSNSSGSLVRHITLTQAAHAEYLTLSVENIEFANKKGSYDVTISSNTHWEITGTTSWLTLSKDKGENNGTVTVSVNDNTTPEALKAVLTIRGSGNTTTLLTVMQAAGTLPTVTVPQVSEVGKNEATLSFHFESEFLVSRYGVCYATHDNPDREHDTDVSQEASQLQGNVTFKLSGLDQGTKYYVRSYAVSVVGVQYSSSAASFTTDANWPGENDVVTPN